MANDKIANNIFDAMSILIDKSISKAGYDKTYKTQIKEVIDASKGLYKVTYENAEYRAYVDDPSVVYELGTDVYILIPSGEPHAAYKKILGATRGSEQVDIEDAAAELLSYYKSSPSFTHSGAELVQNQSQTLIDSASTLKSLLSYLKRADALKIEGTFTSNYTAPIESVVRPPNSFEYGIEIGFTIETQEADKTISKQKTVTFSSKQMTGTPYSYIAATYQSIIIDFAEKGIDVANIISIDAISFYCAPLASGNFEVQLEDFSMHCVNYTALNDSGNTAIVRYNDEDNLEALLLDKDGVEITEGLTYSWWVDTYAGFGDIGETGKVYSGMEDAISYDSLFKCEIVQDGVEYRATAYYYKTENYVEATIERQENGVLKCKLSDQNGDEVSAGYDFVWYKNQSSTGVTNQEYTPSASADLITYYQCVVTKSGGSAIWQEYDDIAVDSSGATFETIKMQYCYWPTDKSEPSFEELEEGTEATGFNSWMDATSDTQLILATPGYFTWTRLTIVDKAKGEQQLKAQCTGNVLESVTLYNSSAAAGPVLGGTKHPYSVDVGTWQDELIAASDSTPEVYSIAGVRVNGGYAIEHDENRELINWGAWSAPKLIYSWFQGEPGAPGTSPITLQLSNDNAALPKYGDLTVFYKYISTDIELWLGDAPQTLSTDDTLQVYFVNGETEYLLVEGEDYTCTREEEEKKWTFTLKDEVSTTFAQHILDANGFSLKFTVTWDRDDAEEGEAEDTVTYICSKAMSVIKIEGASIYKIAPNQVVVTTYMGQTEGEITGSIQRLSAESVESLTEADLESEGLVLSAASKSGGDTDGWELTWNDSTWTLKWTGEGHSGVILTLTKNGIAYDTEDIAFVQSSYHLDLTNNFSQIPSIDKDGNIDSTVLANQSSTSLQLFFGTEKITENVTYEASCDNLPEAENWSEYYSLSGGDFALQKWPASAAVNNQIRVTFSALLNGALVATTSYPLSLLLDQVAYNIIAKSTQNLSYVVTDDNDRATIGFQIQKVTGGGVFEVLEEFPGGFRIVPTYEAQIDGAVAPVCDGTFIVEYTPDMSYRGLRLTLEKEGVVCDQHEIEFLQNGEKGEAGNSYAINLTNDYDVVLVDNNGAPLEGEIDEACTEVQLFNGSSQIVYDEDPEWVLSVSDSSLFEVSGNKVQLIKDAVEDASWIAEEWISTQISLTKAVDDVVLTKTFKVQFLHSDYEYFIQAHAGSFNSTKGSDITFDIIAEKGGVRKKCVVGTDLEETNEYLPWPTGLLLSSTADVELPTYTVTGSGVNEYVPGSISLTGDSPIDLTLSNETEISSESGAYIWDIATFIPVKDGANGSAYAMSLTNPKDTLLIEKSTGFASEEELSEACTGIEIYLNDESVELEIENIILPSPTDFRVDDADGKIYLNKTTSDTFTDGQVFTTDITYKISNNLSLTKTFVVTTEADFEHEYFLKVPATVNISVASPSIPFTVYKDTFDTPASVSDGPFKVTLIGVSKQTNQVSSSFTLSSTSFQASYTMILEQKISTGDWYTWDTAEIVAVSDGAEGPSMTVKSIEYAIGDDSTTPPTDWSDSLPESQPGKYLWTKTTLSDDSSFYSVSLYGSTVSTEVIVIYQANNDLTDPPDKPKTGSYGNWSPNKPSVSSDTPVLWSCSATKTTTNGTSIEQTKWSDPVVAAAFGSNANVTLVNTFNALTNYGALKGFWYADQSGAQIGPEDVTATSQMFINASMIQTGVLNVPDEAGNILFSAGIGDKVYLAGWQVTSSEITQTADGYTTSLRMPTNSSTKVLEVGAALSNVYIYYQGDENTFISCNTPDGSNPDIGGEGGWLGTVATGGTISISPESSDDTLFVAYKYEEDANWRTASGTSFSIEKDSGNLFITVSLSPISEGVTTSFTYESKSYLQANGFLYSEYGQIGGWEIGASSLSKTISGSSSGVKITAPSSENTKVFQCGNISDPSFYIQTDGTFYAENANITCSQLTANKGGEIAGWMIGEKSLSKGNVALTSPADSDTVVIKCGDDFQVQANGHVFANSLVLGKSKETAGAWFSGDGFYVNVKDYGQVTFFGNRIVVSANDESEVSGTLAYWGTIGGEAGLVLGYQPVLYLRGLSGDCVYRGTQMKESDPTSGNGVTDWGVCSNRVVTRSDLAKLLYYRTDVSQPYVDWIDYDKLGQWFREQIIINPDGTTT